MTENRKRELEGLALQFRRGLVELLHGVRTGHPGGSLSCTEILTALYFEVMHVDPSDPDLPGRDRFILSKGHAAPMLYIVMAHRGFFPTDILPTLRQMDSILQGHPCAHKTPGVELSSGPLGLGLSAGIGMALSASLKGTREQVYVLMGDGELQEGAVWEACMSAAKFRTANLTAIVDCNGVQLDGTVEEIMPEGDLAAKFRSFGWNALSCDGHDVSAVTSALAEAKGFREGPTVILAKTVKGKGISFMEGRNEWHGKVIGDGEYAAAMKELGGVTA